MAQTHLTYKIGIRMFNEYGKTSEKTKSIRGLMKRISQLSEDDDMSLTDVQAVLNLINSRFANVDDVFVTAAQTLLTEIVRDGQISDDERALLAQFASMYEQPVSDNPVTEVSGHRFVLTGDFETPGGKEVVKEMINAAGGRVTNNISRATSYVVVGALGSEAWAFGNYGQKVKRALDLRLTGGSNVQIVSEDALMSFFQHKSKEAMDVLDQNTARFAKQWEGAKTVSEDFSGLTEGQQQAFDAVKAGKNVYISGLGGTGKSYILQKIINWARKSGLNVVVSAPTGIAALNIGGCTVHRALGIRPEETLATNPYIYLDDDSPILACGLMIVDEISMCRLDLFDYLTAALRRAAQCRANEGKKPCQLVVVGDFSQLPPVCTKTEHKILNERYGYDIGDGYPFMGKTWDGWNFENVNLTEAIRQRDADFVTALNACRVGDTSGLRWIEAHCAAKPAKNAIILCGKNDEVAYENEKQLRALRTASKTYVAHMSGHLESGDKPTEERLTLKPGARVMALVNSSIETYMNGSLGTVTSCKSDAVTVRFDDTGEVAVRPHEWDITQPAVKSGKVKMETLGTFTQIPLKLAYAITIHKSQGQTFDAVNVHPSCWDAGQLYTALSRVTNIDGLYLAYKVPDASLVTSKDVIDFQEGRPVKRVPIDKKPTSADKSTTAGTQQKATDTSAKVAQKTTSLSTADVASTSSATNADTSPKASRAQHRWTEEEEAFILQNPQMTARELAEKFGVSQKSVEHKRANLRSRAGNS